MHHSDCDMHLTETRPAPQLLRCSAVGLLPACVRPVVELDLVRPMTSLAVDLSACRLHQAQRQCAHDHGVCATYGPPHLCNAFEPPSVLSPPEGGSMSASVSSAVRAGLQLLKRLDRARRDNVVISVPGCVRARGRALEGRRAAHALLRWRHATPCHQPLLATSNLGVPREHCRPCQPHQSRCR